jgi:hypothetical protein
VTVALRPALLVRLAGSNAVFRKDPGEAISPYRNPVTALSFATAFNYQQHLRGCGS